MNEINNQTSSTTRSKSLKREKSNTTGAEIKKGLIKNPIISNEQSRLTKMNSQAALIPEQTKTPVMQSTTMITPSNYTKASIHNPTNPLQLQSKIK